MCFYYKFFSISTPSPLPGEFFVFPVRTEVFKATSMYFMFVEFLQKLNFSLLCRFCFDSHMTLRRVVGWDCTGASKDCNAFIFRDKLPIAVSL